MSLSGKVNVLLNLTHTKALDLDTLQDTISETRGAAFTSGTGANQADIIFHDRRTLADNANETLNLYDSGSLLDAFGDLQLARIVHPVHVVHQELPCPT